MSSNRSSEIIVGAVGVAVGALGVISGFMIAINMLVGPSLPVAQIGGFSFTLFGTISFVWSYALGAILNSVGAIASLLLIFSCIPLMSLISGIGLIRGAGWGRTLAIVYAVGKLCMDVITVLIILIILAAARYGEATAFGGSADLFANIAVMVILVGLSFLYPIAVTIVAANTTRGRARTVGAETMVFRGNTDNSRIPPTADIQGGPNSMSLQSKVTQQISPPGLAQQSARFVVVSGRDLHREYTIALKDFQGNPVRNVLGSGPECQVVISGDATISSRHCEIRMENGHLCLFNLAATNPTIVCRGIDNRFEVSGQEYLRDGDRIWLGSTELSLHVSAFNENDLGR